MIALIWAMDENKTIGKNNRLPWHYPDDLAYFNSITRHKVVLMGMDTYHSMLSYFPSGRLPYEKVFVASRKTKHLDYVHIVSDVQDFLSHYQGELYILGGAKIYKEALMFADRLYITYILSAYQGDTKFPTYDLSSYKLTNYQIYPSLITTQYERK